MKAFIALLLLVCSLGAQVSVNQWTGPEPVAFTTLLFYSGSDLTYTCKAQASQPSYEWSRSSSTLTNIVVLTNTATATTSTAHGLTVNNRVTVTGATVDTDLNAAYVILTVPSTTTFTFATVSVADATYTDSTMRMTTTAPRTTAAIWEIKKFTTASALVTAIQTSGAVAMTGQICDNRATIFAQ